MQMCWPGRLTRSATDNPLRSSLSFGTWQGTDAPREPTLLALAQSAGHG
jgi:hypothetical protein